MWKRKFLDATHKIADHPLLNVAAGAILVITGLLESLASCYEGIAGLNIGAHHGILVFGVLQTMKALPDMLKGLQFVDAGEDGPQGVKLPT